MVIVINSVNGGFSWVHVVWFAAATVRLQNNNKREYSKRYNNHIWDCNGYDC